jgi:hypothetical protein
MVAPSPESGDPEDQLRKARTQGLDQWRQDQRRNDHVRVSISLTSSCARCVGAVEHREHEIAPIRVRVAPFGEAVIVTSRRRVVANHF